MLKGQIIKSTGGLYTVEMEDKSLWNTKPRGVFRKTGETPYVGDYVEVEPAEGITGTIVKIEKRKNDLIRPPVANLDYMVFVVSIKDPAPNFVTLDKFLATMESENIPTIIAITKSDLGDTREVENIYTKAGYPVVVIDNMTGEGTDELRKLLGNNLCAFAGNSGAGKSSLLNALDPSLQVEVGETSKKLGRGKHTTRHVEIFTLADGLRVADTPGFSSMDLLQTADISVETLSDHFIDIQKVAPNCKFRDCIHNAEIGCAVRKAVEQGDIAPTRYQSYLQIYEEIKDVKEWERR